MSRLILAAAAFTLLTSAPALPALAADQAPTQASIAACLSEAQWPVTHSAAYADGSARERERLLNGYDAAVTRYAGLCRLIATSSAPARTEANAQCQQDAADDKTTTHDAARDHLTRMAARCAALAG